MSTPPPRKFFRFQIHLSTAIVLMFVAGGLIWANMTVRLGAVTEPATNERVAIRAIERGFPLTALKASGFTYKIEPSERAETINALESKRAQHLDGTPSYYLFDGEVVICDSLQWKPAVPGIVGNITVLSVVLFATWFLCEWLIRRRAARKGA